MRLTSALPNGPWPVPSASPATAGSRRPASAANRSRRYKSKSGTCKPVATSGRTRPCTCRPNWSNSKGQSHHHPTTAPLPGRPSRPRQTTPLSRLAKTPRQTASRLPSLLLLLPTPRPRPRQKTPLGPGGDIRRPAERADRARPALRPGPRLAVPVLPPSGQGVAAGGAAAAGGLRLLLWPGSARRDPGLDDQPDVADASGAGPAAPARSQGRRLGLVRRSLGAAGPRPLPGRAGRAAEPTAARATAPS